MSSRAFNRALTATGYLMPTGARAPGLFLGGEVGTERLHPVISSKRVGLRADAVFTAQNTPTTIFKDAGGAPPTGDEICRWHEAAWNVGLAPLLWIVTPTDVRLYDCYASPPRANADQAFAEPLGTFPLDAPDRLRALDEMCGRIATETGAFWSSPIGSKINRRHRVDRELLREINALEQRLTALPPAYGKPFGDDRDEIKASRDFAQRLIGRCIFAWYLLDRGIAQHFLPSDLPANLAEIFATTESAFTLFNWLHTTFNGDLFPMDDPQAERDRLGTKHLAFLRDFIEGRSLVLGSSEGQGRLFRFRFDAIPVELISSIYQQFARSSAADEAHLQGLHYTPVELVHLTLDPVFEGLSATARVIDPTCGSGAFLVEAFRRLVWKRARESTASRAVVRDVLYNQLFGIDINRAALGIAAFSLYLAALELDEEPITNAADLKFDRLIDATLFQADTIGGALPAPTLERAFDAVVGNPPWTFIGRMSAPSKRKRGYEQSARPRRSRDWAFLNVAARLARGTGRIGMVMKATPFFSKDVPAVQARSALLRKLAPTALINLSFLRKEYLFPDASGPALLFFARCTLAADLSELLVGSVPWTPDFRRTGVFHVGPGEIHTVPLGRVLRTPPLLKASTFGTVRDGWLIERLEREFPTLDHVLKGIGIEPRVARGQGFKVKGFEQTETPEEYFDLPVVTPDVFTPFRLSFEDLGELTHPTLHRKRRQSIFLGPLLICSKVGSDAGAERGRYSAAVSGSDVLYSQSFYGASFANADSRFAYVLSGILNSSVTAFQLAFGGPTWGLERPTVEPHDLLSLRLPMLPHCKFDRFEAVVEAEKHAAEQPSAPRRLEDLDEAVFDLYELEPDERILARESVARARYLIFENRSERGGLVKPPDATFLQAYAGQVAKSVDAYLYARGERHLEAIIYPRRLTKVDLASGVPGVTAVRFVMVPGRPGDMPIVRDGDPADLNTLAALLRGQLEADIPPYLNERRQLRLYGAEDLFVLKPTESRYWTRTAALNDADVILADHWLRRRDAAVS
jgi:hypothetical protein